MVYISKPN